MADLDLAKFKKVGGDKNCTTLKHENGHELKIAHNGLSAKMKKKLNDLPVYAAEGAAPGIDATDPQLEDDAAAEVPAATEMAPEVDRAPASMEAPQAEPSIAAPAAAPAAQPSAGAGIASQGVDYNRYAQDKHNELLGEAQKEQQDLDAGHITPKTYSDLFANKSTLGKIGTIFGLMLSGAGSGLTGQPNMLLQMMDKQIDRDLEAQKVSAGNRQNLFKMHMQKNLNDAQIKNLEATGAYTKAQMQGLQLDNVFKANAAARITGRNFALYDIGQAVQKIPPGSPMRQQAENTYNSVKEGVAAANAKTAADYAAQSSAVRKKYGSPDLHEARAQATAKPKDNAQDRILNKNAARLFEGLKAAPYVDQGALTGQYNQAVQAEKSLAQVDKVVNSLYDTAKKGGTGGRFERAVHEVGNIPLIGHGLESLWAGAGDSPETRQFLANKQSLYGMVSAALKGTNLGDASIHDVVDRNLPDPADSPEEVKNKIENIKEFIKLHTDTSLLETYGLAPKHN